MQNAETALKHYSSKSFRRILFMRQMLARAFKGRLCISIDKLGKRDATRFLLLDRYDGD